MNTTPADNPCTCRACGVLILANVTDLCEDCEADINAYYDERDRDNQTFADACGNMSREDWDADNDWLASAGWGEM